MLLTLKRKWLSNAATISELYINGTQRQCFVLEDRIREIAGRPVAEWKVYGKTAIPFGRYEVVTSFSQRFQRELPLLLGVPGFDGIRIHPGNTPEDTDGCLLPGTNHTINTVLNSREAFSLLFLIIKREIVNEKVYISIEKADDAEDART